MACPFFEPQIIAAQPHSPRARVPLIDEYDGICRAAAEPVPAHPERRFQCCNHGYSQGVCERFPAAEARCSNRYSVAARSDTALEIVFIEEHDYAPRHWHAARFISATEAIEPEIADPCARAQILAFCRSFLKRYPAPA